MADAAFSTSSSLSLTRTKQPIGGLRFDWLISIPGFIFVAGVYVDGWAHGHGKVDGTFFTPWHAILYTGYALNALLLIGVLYTNHTRGAAWLKAIPSGYEISLIGVPLFAIGGLGDMIWHIVFGIEVGVDQLLSPTHLILATSGIMIITGPLRAAMRRSSATSAPGWKNLLPTFLSILSTLLMFAFFTEYANPFVRTGLVTSDYASTGYFAGLFQGMGVASILLQSAILSGVVLLLLRRWTLPFGTVTFIFTLNMALLAVLSDHYGLIPAVAVASLIADLLLLWLKPSVQRPDTVRIFAFLMPFVLFLCYFADLQLTTGVVWTIHLWMGSIFMAGIVGLLLSYLVVPPQGPAKSQTTE